jgi:hypothetical protein
VEFQHQTEHGQRVDTILGHNDQRSRATGAGANDCDPAPFGLIRADSG